MKAIIFGASGQDGFYLSALLKNKNYEVIGVSRSDDFNRTDISIFKEVEALVIKEQPDLIVHLAANSTTSHDAVFENHATIVTGTLNILEAVRINAPATKVFISGSGLQFKNNNIAIKESDPFEPVDAYSVARIQSVYAARYFRSKGVKAYVGYFFNHDSRLRSERHMTKKIAEAAKRIGKGSAEQLKIGDINAIKEYTYAGDVVTGIWALVNQEDIYEANISSGKGYTIKEWLQECFSLINKNWEDHIVVDNEFKSPYKQLVSDPSLINSLGWKPQVSFKELAKMMMQ